jgi:hypothetical protein
MSKRDLMIQGPEKAMAPPVDRSQDYASHFGRVLLVPAL